MKELAIVILNYKNYLVTMECVRKLLDLKVMSKLILVDNNSPNDSYNILIENFNSYENIEIIKNKENGGYAKGNNVGIKRAISLGYKYIAIMNPDVIIESNDMLDSLINSLKENNLGGITALPITNNNYVFSTIGWKIPNFKELLKLNVAYLKKFKNPIEYTSLRIVDKKNAIAEVDVMPGCFFILTAECFEKIGFFDENTFLYYEENILSIKAKEIGYKFGVALNNIYLHNHFEKDAHLYNYFNKYWDRKILLKSQKYYAKKYLKINRVKSFVLEISQFTNIYVELPLNHIIRKFIKRI